MNTENPIESGFSPLNAPEGDLKAAYHRANKRRVRRGMRLVAERGDFPFRAPLGYVNRREGHRAHIDLDPVAAPLVQEAFALAAVGFPLGTIAVILAKMGLRSKNGKIVGTSALCAVLGNPFYTGQVHFNGEVFRGHHPALASEDDFAAAQELISARRKR